MFQASGPLAETVMVPSCHLAVTVMVPSGHLAVTVMVLCSAAASSPSGLHACFALNACYIVRSVQARGVYLLPLEWPGPYLLADALAEAPACRLAILIRRLIPNPTGRRGDRPCIWWSTINAPVTLRAAHGSAH
jgi:hypothetical protein